MKVVGILVSGTERKLGCIAVLGLIPSLGLVLINDEIKVPVLYTCLILFEINRKREKKMIRNYSISHYFCV